MSRPSAEDLAAHHNARWRGPEQVISHWADADRIDPSALRGRVRGDFWDVLEERGLTLLVTREYEHLVVALTVSEGRPRISWMALPHPSGVAVDADRGTVHVASTRNPNQLIDLRPVGAQLERADAPAADVDARPLVPARSRYLPGCAYLHDLALVGGVLHGTAVGFNAIARLDREGAPLVWWPKAVEAGGRLDDSRNYIQLNSIAAGDDLASSFFTASSATRSRRRPGHVDYPVDGRGVVFSGATRDVIATGLTRPHSARRHRGLIWVDNSGYGELGHIADGRYAAIMRMDGWTRGLAVHDELAFVGTSRVIPRFARYAPGLELRRAVCGVHVVDLDSARTVGSLVWPEGNQIFSVELMPSSFSLGFASRVGDRKPSARLRSLYYRFEPQLPAEAP